MRSVSAVLVTFTARSGPGLDTRLPLLTMTQQPGLMSDEDAIYTRNYSLLVHEKKYGH